MELVWNAPTKPTQIEKGAVHIWRANLDLPTHDFRHLEEKLSIDEKIRAERLRFERDRNRFIVSSGILRTILGYYLDAEPDEIRLRYENRGKPRLGDAFHHTGIHFNLSHSEGLALYIFTRDHEAGIDIERIRDIPEMDKIVEQFFSKRERDVFRKLPERQKRKAFFNGWTCKEAFIKATGDGLSHPLDKFDVSLVPGEPAKLLSIEGDSREASQWSIQHLKLAPNYVGALAVKSQVFETKHWRWG